MAAVRADTATVAACSAAGFEEARCNRSADRAAPADTIRAESFDPPWPNRSDASSLLSSSLSMTVVVYARHRLSVHGRPTASMFRQLTAETRTMAATVVVYVNQQPGETADAVADDGVATSQHACGRSQSPRSTCWRRFVGRGRFAAQRAARGCRRPGRWPGQRPPDPTSLKARSILRG